MFSEYASKFLQQSQTRMSAIREGRLNPQSQAPLFHSAADFLPEDPEHEQEVQDYYALKSSRRHFGGYGERSEGADDEEQGGEYSEEDESTEELRRSRGQRFAGSRIQSSWRPARSDHSSRSGGSRQESVFSDRTVGGSGKGSGKGKGRMVDVDLNESRRLSNDGRIEGEDSIVDSQQNSPFFGYAPRKISSDEEDGDPPAEFTMESPESDDEMASSKFPRNQREDSPELPFARREDIRTSEERPFVPKSTPPPTRPRPTQPTSPELSHILTPSHDRIWATLYTIAITAFFSIGFMVWLHTDATEIPGSDTIYRALQRSIHVLAVETFIAIGIALLWMWLLRAFVKPLVYTLLVAVPVVLMILSTYAFAMSFKSRKYTGQDRVMRWGSIVPMMVSAGWVYTSWKNRNAMHRAVGIIQLACRILGDNPALILLSFGTLIVTCLFTWIFIGMFTRSFLTGAMLLRGTWIWSLNTTSTSLALFYIAMYLWTLNILSGVHRATSSATVSQWYFHRHAVPPLSSTIITTAAFQHSVTTIFGTICFYSFLSLLVRLPLVVAPRRITAFLHFICFQFITSPIAALISPMTLCYAAIHSQPLVASSRQLRDVFATETPGRPGGSNVRHEGQAAYRLAKMLLTAARGIVAAALGMAAWIKAARGSDGSVYGYLVGLIAGTIGWAILGATEGCLGNVVDATKVCVVSESDMGGGTHCREAQLAFGG